jgi:hypothetical protein
LFGVPFARPPQRVPLGGLGGTAAPDETGAMSDPDGKVPIAGTSDKHWTFDVTPPFRYYYSVKLQPQTPLIPDKSSSPGLLAPVPCWRRCLQTSTAFRRRDSGWGFSAPRDDTPRASCGNGAKRKLLSTNSNSFSATGCDC